MTSTRISVFALAAAFTVAATLIPDTADAQGRRGVRQAPRRGGVVVGAYYRPLYYNPFFYDPFWYPYRYGWYPPPYGYNQFYDQNASLRVQVEPKEAEVFVDGGYAGTVDDFDGIFQRLHLEPGEHEVALYLTGYRTETRKIFLQPNGTFNIKHTLEALPAGAPPEPRPVVSTPPAQPRARQARAPRARNSADANFGGIAIRVQPADADVLIDGERWEGPADDEALVIQVAPGAHRIEVRKEGYRSYTAEVDVRAGETAPINVSLPRQDE